MANKCIYSNLISKYRMENFIEGICNHLARSAGNTVAEKPGLTAFNPLVLYGTMGTGKTHFANAIGARIKELFPNKTVIYVSSKTFQMQFSDSVKTRTSDLFIQFYEKSDVLILDDIQAWSNQYPKVQEVFLYILIQLLQHNGQIIITSDRAPIELDGIDSNIRSYLTSGLCAELLTADKETIKLIARQKIETAHIEICDQLVEEIANSFNSSVRDLDGAIATLLAQKSDSPSF